MKQLYVPISSLFRISFSFRSPQSTRQLFPELKSSISYLFYTKYQQCIYISIPNAPPWWKKGSRSQLQLTTTANVARISLLQGKRPWQPFTWKKWILSLSQGSHLQSQDGRRVGGKEERGGKIEAGRRWEGQKEKVRKSPGFWLCLTLHQSFPSRDK